MRFEIIDLNKSISSNYEVYTIGDIHGEFRKFVNTILVGKKLTESIVFVCGDCGFGFHKIKYYEDEISKMNKKLEEKNVHVVFVRGNHDSPEYFKEHSPLKEYSNVIFAKDYSIYKYNDSLYVTIGGAVSVDRSIRRPGPKKDGTAEWWKDEGIVRLSPEDLKLLKDTIDDKGLKYNVISHCAPMNVPPFYSSTVVDYFSNTDEYLQLDLDTEREYLSNIYRNYLNNASTWSYGHYHSSSYHYDEGTKFICNDILQLTNIHIETM